MGKDKEPQKALIGLGANVTSQGLTLRQTLERAIAELIAGGESPCAQSRFFATPCFPAGAGPDYVNAAICVETTRDPAGLLARLHEIEAAFGRVRVQRWGNRVLDLDLLAHGRAVLPDAATFRAWADLPGSEQARRAPSGLVLPHPRMHQHESALVPLLDIAADWRHPVLGLTVREMAARLPQAERAAVKPL